MWPPLIPATPTSWTLTDGSLVHGRVWCADPAPRAAVLYFHGIQSHGAWYEWSASLFAAAGCTVLLADRRGSGMNAPPRGDISSIDQWRDDVDTLANWLIASSSVMRLWVVGLSWGAKLAADLAIRRPDIVERLLLLTPGLFPAVDVGPLGRLRIAASLVRGGRAEHAIPLQDPALFTDNPVAQAFIENDPLKLAHATARFLWHSSRLDAQLRRAPARSICADSSMVLADKDRIIRNAPTVNWLQRLAAAPPKIRVLPAAHTLEFAADRSEFESCLRAWIH